MNIHLIAVGKLSENYVMTGVEAYQKRLQKHVKFSMKEVKNEHAPERLSKKEATQVMNKEGERLLHHVTPRAYVIALDRKGQMFRSDEMAAHLEQLALHGNSTFVFMIGGSLGLGENVLQRADLRWSFSALTFPHQLMRLMVMEQVYRFIQIQNGTPYHK